MRRIERLVDRDPREAFRLAHAALLDKIFDDHLEEKLRLKMDQLIDLVHKQEERYGISGLFAKSVLDITPAQPFYQPPVCAPTLAFAR